MEPKSAFIRADGAVELHTESPIYLSFSVVIYPWNTENNLAFRFYHAEENIFIQLFRMNLSHYVKRFKNLFDCLKKLRIIRIAFFYNF